MARKLCGVFVVLILAMTVCLTCIGCRNGGYGPITQKVKEDRSTGKEIGIARDMPEVGNDYLYALTVKGPAKGHYRLIDCRSAERFDQGTIPTAVSLTGLNGEMEDNLPEDRSVEIIFFCGDSECGSCAGAAALAGEYGYEDVKILRHGIKGWLENGFPMIEGGQAAQVD